MNRPIHIRVTEHDRFVIVEVVGEIDISTAPELRSGLAELVGKGRREIVVDLSGLEFIDSSGLGVLVGGLKRARADGGSLDLVITRESIAKLFRIMGLVKVFEIYGSLEDALSNRSPRRPT